MKYKYLKTNFKNIIIIIFIFLVLNIFFGSINNNNETFNNNEKVAFIIPLYPKHYEYIYNFLTSIPNNVNIDIYIVFSNNDDYNTFKMKDKIKKIIIPENIKTGNIVTYKKFYALEHLKNDENYDYFIVCDAEIEAISDNFIEKNIINKINEIYKNKIIYAGKVVTEQHINITKTSSNLLIAGNDKLEKITENYTLYFWWSDLPVYKRTFLKHFFEIINYNDINWYHFDHIIYLNYLILYHNFNIKNITPYIDNNNYGLESYNTTDINNLYILKSFQYGFSFITKQLYINHNEYLKNEGSFLLYHLDR